ncbi:copia protein [Tanacetum coccineum]
MAKEGIFSVGESRRIIDSKLLLSLVRSTSWDKTLLRKVNIFIWRLGLDRLPHRWNLSARGIDIPSISCPSCNGNVESSSHIFFDCDFAKEVWKLVRNWCDISIPSFSSFELWMAWFDSYGLKCFAGPSWLLFSFENLTWWLMPPSQYLHVPELEMIGSSSRIQITNTILEVPIPQPTGPVIDITPPEQPKSPPATPKVDRGKGKVTNDVESPSKLVKASSKVCPDLDNPIQEEATKAGVDPKILASAKRGQEKKRIEKCRWTISSRLKPETITDVKIHPNTKPVVITIFRGTNKRNFDVHNPFNFGNFGVTEWDELREIIPKKKNKVMQDLMNSLSKRYEKLGTIPDELGIRSNLPAPRQILSITSRRKRKHQELNPETHIPGLECNRSLPKGIPFVNNMVIEQAEHGMFFIDVFGDEAFQRMSDIHKVDVENLLTYLVMASNISIPENQKFCLTLRKLIGSHPDQEKLKSKKVKLESVGYKLD